LITKRPEHVHQGGLWEFPGGKLETGETPNEGLARELFEELGIRVRSSRPLIRVHHDYGDRHVLLDVHRVVAFAGDPRGREGQPLAWVHPEDMVAETFPAADRPIISALRLPSLYLITGPDPNDPREWRDRLSAALKRGVRLVQLRARELAAADYDCLARDAFDLREREGARLLLNTDPERARDLPCHGLHLTSRRLWQSGAGRPGGLEWVGASCHDNADLARAADLGLDYALLSPVTRTATHPQVAPLGWHRFAELVDEAALPVYALGGLGLGDLAQAINLGAQGIAAIRGLWSAP
jgi:8-oxo-dGTP diphosphatase